MAKIKVTEFSPGWYNSGPNGVRLHTGWGLDSIANIVRSKSADGTWTSGEMSDDEALRVAQAFEKAGCTVELLT